MKDTHEQEHMSVAKVVELIGELAGKLGSSREECRGGSVPDHPEDQGC